jgi:hypothetical protein
LTDFVESTPPIKTEAKSLFFDREKFAKIILQTPLGFKKTQMGADNKK